MLPNRCQNALTSAANGVVKPFVRRDTSFPLDLEEVNQGIFS